MYCPNGSLGPLVPLVPLSILPSLRIFFNANQRRADMPRAEPVSKCQWPRVPAPPTPHSLYDPLYRCTSLPLLQYVGTRSMPPMPLTPAHPDPRGGRIEATRGLCINRMFLTIKPLFMLRVAIEIEHPGSCF